MTKAEYAAYKNTIKTLADVDPHGIPECLHCGIVMDATSKASLEGNAVVVYCRACGCLTPFPIAA